MLEFYRTIWRESGRRQVVLIFFSLFIAALAAAPLKFQQELVNLLGEKAFEREELFALCVGMMAVITLSLGSKMFLSYRSSILGEDLTRMIRARLLAASVNTVESGQKVPSGSLASAISSEAEKVGQFAGSAFSDPLLQLGTLVSVIAFVAATQPGLGTVAIMIIAPQVFLVRFTQVRINRFVAERIRLLRSATNEITSEDLRSAQAEIGAYFDSIFQTRRQIFKWKVTTKFLLSMVNSAGIVIVLLLGGLFVLEGKTDVGTVVAATTGLTRIQGPSAFLISFYRQISVNRVMFELLVNLVSAPRKEDELA